MKSSLRLTGPIARLFVKNGCWKKEGASVRIRNEWLIVRLLKLAGPLTSVLLFSAFAGVLSSLSVTALFLLGAYGTIKVISGDISLLWNVVCALLVFAFLRGFFRYLEQYSGHYVAFRLLAVLRDRVFGALRRLAPAKMEVKNSGELVSAVTGDIELIEVFYAHTIAPVLVGLVVSVVMTLFLGALHPAFGLIGLAGYVALGMILPLVNYALEKELGRESRKTAGLFQHLLLDVFTGIRDIRMFGRTKDFAHKMTEMETLQNDKETRLGMNAFLLNDIGGSIQLLTTFAILFTGSLLTSVDAVSHFAVFYAAVGFFASSAPVRSLNRLGNGLIPAFAACRRIFSLLDETPAVSEAKQAATPGAPGNLELKAVGFDYEAGGEVLDDIDLTVKKGEKIGICGASGCGKSTLLKLIMRFWDPSRGRIELSGLPLTQIRMKALRTMEAVSLQDAFLFNRSIADNIRVGNPQATDEEVAAAAERVNLSQMIERLPAGFQTKVGELGDRLSTGERQRLALARLFVRYSELILLDEPTSNIDRLNERAILRSFQQQFADRTMVIVSHRRSALNIADTVYELKDGKLQRVR
jgi:ATP-binding cassette subfamily C protein